MATYISLFLSRVLHFLLEGEKIQITGMMIRIMKAGRPFTVFNHLSKILSAGSIKQNHEIGPGVCGYARGGGFEVDAEIRARSDYGDRERGTKNNSLGSFLSFTVYPLLLLNSYCK